MHQYFYCKDKFQKNFELMKITLNNYIIEKSFMDMDAQQDSEIIKILILIT